MTALLAHVDQPPAPAVVEHQGATVTRLDERREISREHAEQVRAHARTKAKAANTRRGYASDWRQFRRWLYPAAAAEQDRVIAERRKRGERFRLDDPDIDAILPEPPLPVDAYTVEAYLTDLAATARASTITRHRSAIAYYHRRPRVEGVEPCDPPALDPDFMPGLLRALAEHGRSEQRGQDALTLDELRRMADAADRADLPLQGLRDRAVLLVGFGAALRRSEIAALRVEHLTRTVDGYVLHLPTSKTDQGGEGRDVPLPVQPGSPYCPVRALDAWRDAAAITDGPVFRAVARNGRVGADPIDPRAVDRVVKRLARRAGLDPDRRLAAHSLRAGFITTMAEHDVPEHIIAQTTGHESTRVLRSYIRSANLMRHAALNRVRL